MMYRERLKTTRPFQVFVVEYQENMLLSGDGKE